MMAFQQNFGSDSVNFESGDTAHKQKWSSVSQLATISENLNGCFDCNICLDSSHDPVVTLCGHLYCWPCIYKWLQVENSSLESDEGPKCPVCKAHISTSSLVPLYGRGASDSESKKPQLDSTVPQRPRALGMNALLAAATSMTSNSNHQNHQRIPLQTLNHGFHQQQYSYSSLASPTVFNTVGEMVFARMFGSSDTSLFAYPYSNSYLFSGNGGGSRLRRQERQVDESLNRVSIFLFCCIVLCLILF